MNLKSRCINILLFILSQDKPVKISYLRDTYKVSERTIRYDLNEIEYWLNSQGLGKLKVIYSEGINISCTHEDKIRIFKLFEGKLPNDYFYSSEERQKIIILELLNSSQPLKIEVMQRKLSISRGTVIKELKIVEDWLGNYNLKLVKKPNYGLEIQGEEASKRTALLSIAKNYLTTEQILSLIKDHEKKTAYYDTPQKKYGIRQDKLLFNIDLALLEESLYKLQDLLVAHLEDSSFATLFTHLAIALQRIKAGKEIFIPYEELEILENTSEYKIAEKFSTLLEKNFNLCIPKSEIGYITLHILSAQLQKPSTADNNRPFIEETAASGSIIPQGILLRNNEIDYLQMATDITNYVKKLLNIEFKDDRQLILDLCTHLKPALNRCKYNMFLTNPLLDNIRKNYYRVFLVVREAFLMMHIKYPFEINDHEISYIVLHFAAEIEKEKVQYHKCLNVLLVCASGVGTAKILNSRLAATFRDLNIVDTISYLDFYKKDDWNADLIISTINVKSSTIPCLAVNPLLNEDDIMKIEEYLLMNASKQIKGHTPIPAGMQENHMSSQSISPNNNCQSTDFNSDYSVSSIPIHINNAQLSLSSLLTENTIKLDVSAADWEEAVASGAELLLQQNLIEPRYISALKETIKQLGPYIVIAPGIALSHSKQESGVLRLGMSMLRLKNPVEFGHKDNDPVKLVFTLAPIDNISHHKALSQLMKIFLNKKYLDVLLNSNSQKDILECISTHSN